MNLPPNLYPSSVKIDKKKSNKSKLLLMKDFGLTPDQPMLTMSRSSLKCETRRTITLSDFMGKKNTRKLFNSHDLGTLSYKLKKNVFISQEIPRKSKQELTCLKHMDEMVKIKINENLKKKRKTYPCMKKCLTSPPKLQKHRLEINFLDNLVNSCDILLEDNKKVIENLIKYSTVHTQKSKKLSKQAWIKRKT